jgi:DNA polymerase III epsilon subunit family exonuclease
MILRSISEKNVRLVFFDLETTGFNIFHNSIIEIAAIDNYGNTFSRLIKYEKSLPKKIVEITNITDELLQSEGENINVVLNDFKKFLEKYNSTTYLVGHNAYSFDIPFIKAQFQKYNLKFPNYDTLDTMRIAQLLMPSEWSHSLSNLCSLFGIQNKQAHRALSDVYATQSVYKNLLIIYRSRFKDEVVSIANILKKTRFY